ncbi:hypothetical protein CPB84DRAFT_150657 [Gymnopilus junonius]|uniref:Uncharacterized protein n=1 Tax=Gymnopilus junonius TaxID=109634 RepID=A0A9P5NDY4_GYMJU|nr:hypothetical protein CPB84DRAFT_150657 [Gymnopilus junonius]
MEACPEPLEQIFQKIEEESERRAEEEALSSQQLPPVLETDGEPALQRNYSALVHQAKQHRRGSVSISRIGQITVEDFARSPTPASPTHRSLAPKSSFYKAQIANESTTSVASGASAFSDDDAHAEDANHVTQMHHIVGKQSIPAKMLPRRLSRSQSTSVMPTRGTHNMEPPVIIDVVVQEATVESPLEPGDTETGNVTVSRRASVSAQPPPKALRHESSRSTIPTLKLPPATWFSKVKNFSLIFKRKSSPSLSAEHHP